MMKVYLACTVRGDRGGVEAGRALAARLQARGHEVLTLHLLDDQVEAAESRLTAADVYRRDLEWLTACDLLVAEASGSSYGVGFEVGYVLGRAAATGQRAVLCYHTARTHAVSRLIAGNVDPHCETVAYDSVEELETRIDAALDALEAARTARSTEA